MATRRKTRTEPETSVATVDVPATPVTRTPKYDAAMEARRNGTLGRKVLTELGWVTPHRPDPEE